MKEKEFLPIRTLFVSDVHLGSRHSQCGHLVRFLRRFRPETVYLVGDIFDGRLLKRRFRWDPSYSELLHLLVEWADRGPRLRYCPGNHDEFWRRDAHLLDMGGRLDLVEIRDEFIFTALNGQRFLVMHGDQFDPLEHTAGWVSRMFAGMYDIGLSANWWYHRLLGRRGSPYRACAAVKKWAKKWVKFYSAFERRVFDLVRKRRCQGLICGHLHAPAIVQQAGLMYCNIGDWVEHCTALVEHLDGTLQLIPYYGDETSSAFSGPRVARPIQHST